MLHIGNNASALAVRMVLHTIERETLEPGLTLSVEVGAAVGLHAGWS
jgi:hypothetical protein